MRTDVFIKDGVEIRRLKSGRCVREGKWQQYSRKVLNALYLIA